MARRHARLAESLTVACADLRGHGGGSTPASTPDHAPYSKRAMVEVMGQLGFEHFSVAGHHRGGRVAYRLALDYPERADRLAVLDVLPVEDVWSRVHDRLMLGYWPRALLA